MPASTTARLVGLLRLGHPFPSLLDAAVVAALAGVAGADVPRIALLAAAMLALQLGIGAANDWADAPLDTGTRPDKPVPAGLVSRAAAARAAIVLAGAGLGLAAISGLATLVLAVAGLAAGIAYDLRLKGTPWSWLPYAVGIPLLPVFAWVGATGRVPAAFGVLVPVAVVAGAALAVANALADLERDRRAGVATVATTLGLTGARRVGGLLQGAVVATATGSALALGADPRGVALGALGAAITVLGVALGWRSGRGARQHAWEVQAIGLALVAAGWAGGLAAAGRLGG